MRKQKAIYSKILFIIILIIAIFILNHFIQTDEPLTFFVKDIKETPEEEQQPIIIYTEKIHPENLTQQQLTRAKAMTKEAQIKEFGGILGED